MAARQTSQPASSEIPSWAFATLPLSLLDLPLLTRRDAASALPGRRGARQSVIAVWSLTWGAVGVCSRRGRGSSGSSSSSSTTARAAGERADHENGGWACWLADREKAAGQVWQTLGTFGFGASAAEGEGGLAARALIRPLRFAIFWDAIVIPARPRHRIPCRAASACSCCCLCQCRRAGLSAPSSSLTIISTSFPRPSSLVGTARRCCARSRRNETARGCASDVVVLCRRSNSCISFAPASAPGFPPPIALAAEHQHPARGHRRRQHDRVPPLPPFHALSHPLTPLPLHLSSSTADKLLGCAGENVAQHCHSSAASNHPHRGGCNARKPVVPPEGNAHRVQIRSLLLMTSSRTPNTSLERSTRKI